MPRIKKWEQKPSYLEFYRDPRWQKVRLEVMQRDGFSCVSCGDETSTLNVHHGYYEDGKKPWEYPQTSLHTMCEECHVAEKESIKDEKSFLLRQFGRYGFLSEDIETFSKAFFDYFHKRDKTAQNFLNFFIDAIWKETNG